MKSDQFEGHSSEMKKPTMWLASEDIMGRTPVNVTIEKCFRHKGAEFDQGRKEDVYALKFRGKKKQLVLNATNRKELVRQYGVDVKGWIDKPVALTVVDCKMMGKMVKGIRIIEATSAPRKPAPVQPEPEPPVAPEQPWLAYWQDALHHAPTEQRVEEITVEAQDELDEDRLAILEPYIEQKRRQLEGELF